MQLTETVSLSSGKKDGNTEPVFRFRNVVELHPDFQVILYDFEMSEERFEDKSGMLWFRCDVFRDVANDTSDESSLDVISSAIKDDVVFKQALDEALHQLLRNSIDHLVALDAEKTT